MMQPRPYDSEPLHPSYGLRITNLDLKSAVTPEAVQAIKEDLKNHRMLLFKNQGIVPGERQVNFVPIGLKHKLCL